MKHIKKYVAIILSVVLMSTLLLPITCFAAGDSERGDHTTFEEFWAEMTNEDGSINWRKLPDFLFKAFFLIRLFEMIGEFFRGLFGGNSEPAPEVTTVAPETTTEAPVVVVDPEAVEIIA